MDFYEVLDQVIDLLRNRGRVSYRALKVQFKLDDESLEALKDELIKAQRLAVDEDGSVLVWIGTDQTTQKSASQPDQTTQQPVTLEDQPTQVEVPRSEPHTPDAERRQLTVMFCDLVGSTPLSEQLDPEDLREVVRAYQQTCAEVIQRFDGHIAQLLGDALLVYFGWPTAHEDDAQRAVRTGLGMLDAMGTLNIRLERDKGLRLAIRVGIHTGMVVVGEMGSGCHQEQLALGDVPNIASRLQGLAEPDTVVISEATYRLVQGYFDCDDLGFHTLKGVTEAVQVYRVLQESGAQSRLEVAATRGLTPLVGREQEVGLLLERWNQVKDSSGQVVLLSGEAGIGKSRLVQVLKDHVADEPYTRWECRSSPYYQNTALYPLTDLFQRTLRWQPEDAPEEKLEKLEQRLKQYRLDGEKAVPLFAALLSLPIPEERYPPLNLSPQRQRQQTLEAILAVLLELAEPQPVLFILEDLHWTDPTTLEFLDLLIDQIPTAAIYTLLTCRPTFQPSWHHRSYLTEVTLNRLSRNQIERMIERITHPKALPTEIVQQLVNKTDGVPLYVEEMTKAVLESGLLKERDGQYELTGPLSSLAIPATLQDSLMARLDRLVTAKGIAQMGATIGRTFSYELLQAVASVDEGTLQRELRRLVEAELLYQRGLAPQATYLFKHALVVDAAYQSLLKSTRQQYHQRIGQVLEERFPEIAENQPELLAHHFTEAGRSEQAVDYWSKAGQRAVERSANVEGIAHLSTGLELLQALPETPERLQQELALQTALGPALTATKGFSAQETEDAYIRAHELCRRIGDPPQRFLVLRGLCSVYNVQAKYQAAHALTEELLRIAQQEQDPLLLATAHFTLGTVSHWLGEFVSARRYLEEGTTFYRPQQHWVPVLRTVHDPGVGCLVRTAEALWMQGFSDQAVERIHAALRLAQTMPHPFTLGFALINLAQVSHYRREVQTVREWAEAGIALAEEQGFPFWWAWAAVLRGWALAMLGQGEEGTAQMRQGLDVLRAIDAKMGQTYLQALLVEALEEGGQIEEGLAVLNEALSLVDKTGERFYEAELHRLKGELLLQQSPDNHTDAETCFHKALDVAKRQEAKSLELRAATSLSRLQKQQGKRDEARQLLGEVYGWFTEGFDTADLKEAKALLDELV
jgi:TOMM system kinase/cyclase fusion protein